MGMNTDIAIDAAGFSITSVIIMVAVTVLSCILTWMCGVACGTGICHHVMKSQPPVLIQEPNKELVGITTKINLASWVPSYSPIFIAPMALKL